MKKLFLGFVFMLVMVTSALAEEGFDPSQTPWGQNIQETAEILGLPLEEGTDNLMVQGPNVFGFKSVVIYIFEEDELVCVSQIVAQGLNAQLDDDTLKVLYLEMGTAYDEILGEGNRLFENYFAWLMPDGDYLFLNDEFDQGRVNLRRMPEEIWEKYWAHQF